MNEYTVMTQDDKGGTCAVTQRAFSPVDAIAQVLRRGYFYVLWVL